MKERVIEGIWHLPRTCKRVHQSLLSLAGESAVAAIANELLVEDIQTCLKSHTTLPGKWQAWSEDKRTSEGYFLSPGHTKRIIGAFDSGGRKIFRKEFQDKTAACAEYILRETFSSLNMPFNFWYD